MRRSESSLPCVFMPICCLRYIQNSIKDMINLVTEQNRPSQNEQSASYLYLYLGETVKACSSDDWGFD
jgi:hypothetical protein